MDIKPHDVHSIIAGHKRDKHWINNFFLTLTASAPGAVIPQSSMVRGHLLVIDRQLPP